MLVSKKNTLNEQDFIGNFWMIYYFFYSFYIGLIIDACIQVATMIILDESIEYYLYTVNQIGSFPSYKIEKLVLYSCSKPTLCLQIACVVQLTA